MKSNRQRRLELVVPALLACVLSAGGATGAVSIAGATGERANLWVAPSGGSCARQATRAAFSGASACASVGAAYGAAAAGDVVVVRAGTYGRQVVPGGTKRVTIRAAKGAHPILGTTKVDASNITLTGFKIERNDDPGAYIATLEVNGSGNTFDRIDVDSKFMTSAVNGRQGINNIGDRNLYKNGSTFNVIDDKAALIGGKGVTFDNFDFHDVRASGELVHNECAYSLAPNLTIRNSHFWSCATMDLFIERGAWFGQPLYCCVTLENNVFEHTTSLAPDAWHHYSLGIHGGDVQEMRNWRVVNNTFETTVGGDLPAPGTVWANNIGAWVCNPGATYANNVGTKCSASDRAVTPDTSCGPPSCNRLITAPFGWVDPARHDFRLKPGSPAINRGDPGRAPARDNDGYRRPLGSAPEVGAYEYGTGVLMGHAGRVGHAMKTFEKKNGANLSVTLGAGGSYVRRLRDVEVVVLNSGSVSSAQTGWLRRTLGRSSSVPRVVVLRQGPYSCGGSLGSSAVRSAWVPLFRRYGVRLVVSGGDRNYQRFAAGRLPYVVTGAIASSGGGACPRSYPRRRVNRSAQSFLYLTADAGGVNVRAVDTAGRTIDRFRVK